MGTFALGAFLRYLVTLLIGFFVARHMLADDVARKLYAGDTVELWGGAWTVNLKQIVDFLSVAIPPMLVPLAYSIWSMVKARYALIMARTFPAVLSKAEVKAIVSDTPNSQIIKTVLADNKPKPDITMNTATTLLLLSAFCFLFTACPDMTPEQARSQADVAAAYANAAHTVIHGAVEDYKEVQDATR